MTEKMTISSERAGPQNVGSSLVGAVSVTIVAVLLLTLSGWLARADLEQARAIYSRGDHARSVEIAAGRLLATVTDAETGQRGYLLTGDSSYLEPYEAARARLSADFAELRAMSQVHGESAPQLEALEGLITQKMAVLGQTIADAKSGSQAAALALVRSNRGKEIMDVVRARIAEMNSGADAEFLRAQLQARSVWPAVSVVGLELLSSLLLLSVAIGQWRARRAVSANFASLKRFTRAFDLSHGMMREMDGTIVYWTDGMERLYGYTAEEAVGQISHRLLATTFPGPLLQIIEVLERQGQWQGELAHHHRDGTLIEVASHWALQRDADGRMIGVIEVNNNVTETRRAQRESEATSELLAAIVASSDDAILSKTVEGVVTSWNTGAERLFGYTAAEAVGQNIRFIIPPGRQSDEEKNIASLLAGASTEHYESVRMAKDGRLVEISASISPIHDKAGRIIGVAKVARDIAARKRHEAERAQYVQALERSNKELDDFAYIASHDLKEPLRGLFNNAKFLHEDYAEKLDADGVKRLLRLGYLSQRMEQLVNDLLYFSRLGRQDLAIQLTDMNAVIRDIELMSQTFLEEHRAAVVIPRPLPRMLCDKTRIAEVFRNLITNAVKYNESQSKRVEVGFLDAMATASGVERQVFYVKDNGIGIAAEFHTDVFRIFKRLNAEDDDKKGNGVGLTFVSKIVQRHAGRIWIDSALGAGATFYFTIGQGQVNAAAA